MLQGITIMALAGLEPLATLAPMSSLFCASILADFAPSSFCTRSLRPFTSSSSANTRRALSEAMKLTFLMRQSCSTTCNRARVHGAPLAPVAAIVRTWGSAMGIDDEHREPERQSQEPGCFSPRRRGGAENNWLRFLGVLAVENRLTVPPLATGLDILPVSAPPR